MNEYKPVHPKFKILAPVKSELNKVVINSSRLAFLPSLFVTFIVIVGLLGLFIYFNPIGLFTRHPEVAGVSDKIQLGTLGEKIPDPANTSSIDSGKEKSLVVYNGDLSCKLIYPSNFTLTIISAIKKDSQSWWIPDVNQCSDSNLQALQIVKLSSEEGKDIKEKLNPSNIFLISYTDQVYALAYTKDNQITNYNFSVLGENFLDPIFSSSKTFNSAKMYDARIVEDYSYYLSSGCSPKSNESGCFLWKQNQFSGVIYKVKTNFFEDLANNAISLDKNKSYIKFAKKQDTQTDLSFIAGEVGQSKFYLLKMGIKSSSIISVTKFEQGEEDYSLYFR